MRPLTLFLALIVTLNAAFASLTITVVNHDTDVQSTYQYLKVCSCGGTVDVVRIKNIGDLQANYVLTLEADQPWFTLEKQSVYLQPGESRDVSVYTNAPCGASGQGHYTVYVASEYGRYRAIDKTIQTGICENILFDVTPDASTVEPCGTATFTLHLTNTATFRETYLVEGLNFPSVSLDPGETGVLTGTYTAACTEWGEKTIPITVRSEKNNLASSTSVQITVPRNYDYNVSFATIDRPICQGVTNTIPVSVQNIENRGNTFEISGKPNSDSRTVYIAGGETAIIDLPFTPSQSELTSFSVQAKGMNGSIEKQIKVDLPVEACYGYTVNSPQRVAACPGDITVPFTITSVGTQSQQLTLDIQSNITTRTDGLYERLQPSQEITKNVQVTLPDADREYYVTLAAASAYAAANSTTTVQAYSTESCYAITPTAHKFRVWTDQTSVPVLIKQTGIQPGTYAVRYDGTFLTPREQTITLEPGDQIVIHLDAAIAGHEPGRYVDRLTLSSHGVDYTTDFEILLAEKGFFEKLKDLWRWDAEFLVCSILTVLAALFLIAVIVGTLGIVLGLIHYQNPTSWKKDRIGLVGGAVLIVLLLLLIATVPHIPRTYEQPIAPSDASALQFSIGQGQELILNLDQLFVDPDLDPLSFTATPTEGLLVKIEGNQATLKPKNGFRGEETLVFTANDKKGGVTDSGLVHVNVVGYKSLGVLDYWLRGCWFISLAMITLGALILLLVLLFSPMKPEQQRALVSRKRKSDTEILTTDELGRELTPLEKDVLRQAHTMVTAENLVQAQNITINQGTTEQLYVASQDGNRFHKITCPIVKGMPKDKRVTFANRDDAIKAGYTPCKTCGSHE